MIDDNAVGNFFFKYVRSSSFDARQDGNWSVKLDAVSRQLFSGKPSLFSIRRYIRPRTVCRIFF